MLLKRGISANLMDHLAGMQTVPVTVIEKKKKTKKVKRKRKKAKTRKHTHKTQQ